jgi:hypothetical protein
VVLGEDRGLDDGERDAATADRPRRGAHRLVERFAQIVMNPVADDDEIPNRIGCARAAASPRIRARAASIRGQQVRARIGGRGGGRRAGNRRAVSRGDADAGQPHHRDVVLLDRDLVNEPATLLGTCRGATVTTFTSLFPSRDSVTRTTRWVGETSSV